MLCEGDGVHRLVCMPECHGVKRLADERQRGHAGDILPRVAGHRRAHRNAVGEQRKGEPPDHPHPRQLRKEHLARVVDEHADAGDQTEQAAILIGFDLRRAKKGIEHAQASLAGGKRTDDRKRRYKDNRFLSKSQARE